MSDPGPVLAQRTSCRVGGLASSQPGQQSLGSAERGRRIDVEVLRILGAVLVMTIHVTSGFISEPERLRVLTGTYWVALVANMASRCAVPMFFAISGWALLARAERDDEVDWLRRRLTRLFLPLLAWDVVFVGMAWFVSRAKGSYPWPAGSGPVDWLLKGAGAIAFGPGTAPHLWFMYYLVPVTVTIWLVRVGPRTIASPRSRSAFVLVVAGLIVPYGLVGAVGATLSWSIFGWALGYALLGHVLLETAAPRRWVSAGLFLGATAGLLVAERAIGYNQWEMAYPGPLVMAQTIGLIGLVRAIRIPDRWAPRLLAAAELTFGVYLAHLLFVQSFAIAIGRPQMPLSLALAVTWLATLVLSFALVGAWHRVPNAERVLG